MPRLPSAEAKPAPQESFYHIDSGSIDDDGPLMTEGDDEPSTHGDLSVVSINKLSSQTSDTESASEQRRDEIQDIRNRSRNEDRRVGLWRSVLLVVIQIIGATVAGLTYYVLCEEENKAMTIAVCTFDCNKRRQLRTLWLSLNTARLLSTSSFPRL